MLLNALSFSAAYVSKTLMFFSPGTQTYLHFLGEKNAHQKPTPTLHPPGQNVLFSDAVPHMRNHTLLPDYPS